jgi:hypothetical protein
MPARASVCEIAMDGTGTPLIEVIKGARGLLLHSPEITAVHIVDVREVDAFDRWWAEQLIESDELQLLHPRTASWIVTRTPEPGSAPAPRPAPQRDKVIRKLNAISQWSAGFEVLSEGAR